MSDPRPDVYVEDGKVIYRASALGVCIKALTAMRGGEIEVKDEGLSSPVLAEGDLHETAVKDKLKAEGWIIYDEQLEVDLEVMPGVFVRGHLDGLCKPPWDPANTHVLEVKSMSKDVFAKWERLGLDSQPGYALQISVYMHALKLPGIFAIKDRNMGKRTSLVLTEAPVEFEDIVFRVALVEDAHKRGELPECDIIEQWRCPMPQFHPPVIIPDEGEVSDPSLDALLSAYHSALESEKLASIEREILRDQIMERLGPRRAMQVRTDQFKIVMRQNTQKRLNSSKVRNFLGKKVSQFQETSVSYNLLVDKRD